MQDLFDQFLADDEELKEVIKLIPRNNDGNESMDLGEYERYGDHRLCVCHKYVIYVYYVNKMLLFCIYYI